MKKLLILVSCLWLTTAMNAQFLDRLINSARTTAEQSVEQQVNKKVEEGINKAFNPESQQQEQQEQVEQQPQEQPKSGWTCTTYRGHFLRTAKTVSCLAHTNTILCKHSYYLSVLNR